MGNPPGSIGASYDRSIFSKATIATNTKKALAFLVKSRALYLCIWVDLIYLPSTVLHKWTHPHLLVDCVYHCNFDGPRCGPSLEHNTTIVQLVVRPLLFYACQFRGQLLPGYILNGDCCHHHDATEHRRHSVSSWHCASM